MILPAIRRASAAPRVSDLGTLVAWSALIGAAFGAAGPVHQNAAEAAQVVAGLVQGDPPTAFSIQQTQPWSIVTQFAAAALLGGVPPDLLSVLVSALIGATGFAAVSLLAHVAGAPGRLALLLPPFLLACGLLDVGDLHYPIHLAFTPYSWGALGFWTALLGFGLHAAGRIRAAAVVLGLLPAIHPGIALLVAPAVLAMGLARLRDDPGALRRVLPAAAAALGVTAASLALHLGALRLPLPPATAEAAMLAGAWQDGFDIHRRPIPPTAWTLAIVCFAALVPLLMRRADRPAREAFAALGLIGAAGLLAQALNAFAPDLLPALLSKPIPGRLVAFPVVVAAVGAAALLAGGGAAGRAGLVLIGAALLAAAPGAPLDGWERAIHAAAMALALLLVLRGRGGEPVRREGRAARLLQGAAAAAVFAAAAWQVPTQGWARFAADRAGSSAAAAAARDGGSPILSGPMLEAVQIRSGRPVVIETAQMDQIYYAPGLASAFHRLVAELYGVDFTALPEPALRHGMLYPFDARIRALWEARTAATWAELASRFGFGAVWVRSGWRLDLPLLADDGEVAVYRVPAAR